MQNITISTKYFVNLIKFFDSMIILLLKSSFQISIGSSLFSGSGTEMMSHSKFKMSIIAAKREFDMKFWISP